MPIVWFACHSTLEVMPLLAAHSVRGQSENHMVSLKQNQAGVQDDGTHYVAVGMISNEPALG